jgi:LmbE family N-acetylglucosaminyl deacetylase
MRILAIGAHPDDLELGAGGTIARNVKNNHDVRFLILTFGETGGGRPEVRRKEAIESAALLGVRQVLFAGIPDRNVSEGIETIDKIEEVVNAFKPDRVLTHSLSDRHQDHRNASKATFSAARKVNDILCYESPLTGPYPSFSPQAFCDITGFFELKKKAIDCFRSQRSKEALKAVALEGLARFRGFQAGVMYAEAFEIGRIRI